jgi:serine/threonine-protein kinase RsbT
MTLVTPAGEIQIRAEHDIVTARRTVRDSATQAGFPATDVTRIVTAASELARNVFKYAGEGVMRWRILQPANRVGIELQFEDRGPGIADIQLAMEDGYSTGGGLGQGLPGARRLVDELDIQSKVGEGTTVTVKKWRRT